MKAFSNTNVYIHGKGIIKTNVLFNEKIISIGEDVSNAEIIPLEDDVIVCPGFIDQHIHGADGFDAMDGSSSALDKIANAIKKEGVTSFLATTMTESKEKIKKALLVIGEYAEKENDGARVLGAHLEGPFISETFCGAQDSKYILSPNVSDLEEFYKASNGHILLVTYAPEKDNGEFLEKLNELKITPSCGHTNAKYENVLSAVEKGLKCVTHTYNVQSPLHHREVGVVGSALLLDELYTECICDGVHISIPAIKLLLKNKNKDKFILVSDAMRAKYLPDGESELGGQKVIVKNGEARLTNGALAGSVLNMNKAIENLVKKCGVKIEDAIDFASLNPAKNLNVDDMYGSIQVNKVSDFAVLDKDFNVVKTIKAGKTIYEK